MRWTPCLFVLAFATSVPAGAQAPSPRTSLIQADRAAAADVFHNGLVAGLGNALDEHAVFLLEGAPVIRGRERIATLLRSQGSLAALRMQWFPTIAAVSEDGLFGVTTGATLLGWEGQRDSAQRLGHYISVWQRSGDGPWHIIALLENGLLNPDSTVVSQAMRSMPGTLGVSDGAQPFAQADLAFAKLAADSGAPAAFGAWAAPDVTTPPGTGIMAIGPEQMRARIAAGSAAGVPWEWHPVWGAAAGSGDLAVTVGLSKIGAGADAYIGKYLTVWRRQPDGRIRFILDSGNPRPK